MKNAELIATASSFYMLKPEAFQNNFEEQLEEVLQEEVQLEEVSSRLIIREEQLFCLDGQQLEQEEDRLHRDFQALRLQMLMAVHNIFTSSFRTSSLRSAMASLQQQEQQDRRWAGIPEDRVPPWRPLKSLEEHLRVLQEEVHCRLTAEEEGGAALNTTLKREVFRMGLRVKEDLLMVVRVLLECYPPQMDILSVYSGLFHQSLSARLTALAARSLQTEDCSYLLFWVNHCYPQEILNHEELKGKILPACLGPLLLQEHQDRLEDQYLTHKQDQTKLWLDTALRKEEESWLSSREPEIIDEYCFSPLAIDVLQVLDSSLTECSSVLGDQRKAQRLTAHLENFLSSYRKCVESFVKGKHRNALTVIKAQLVCEQQLRDYITGQTGSLSEQQRRRCLDTLAALKDCGYRCLTCPIHLQMKVCLSHLWTPAWIHGSLPAIDSLLHFVSQQLMDLKPACRQWVLMELQQEVCVQYVRRTRRMMKMRRQQQEEGAERMRSDALKISAFFKEGGVAVSLQDPGLVHQEVLRLTRSCPDLSDAHLSALLVLYSGQSSASVEETRLLAVSSNLNSSFFFGVKKPASSETLQNFVPGHMGAFLHVQSPPQSGGPG
ncbi:tumor necrosis factor alpha-induced protein 2-like [Eleginops maclovinus]|uniref:tumor necrosis factor alpha-induced protein 2-like n=1 Tax=Eleginops maclovinus TaxID=56733 RepID=UPI0030803304